MSSDWDLKPFFWTLNILGLFNCHYSYGSASHIYTNRYDKICSITALCVSQLICWTMILYWIMHSQQFHIKGYNRTGNTYLSTHFGFCCLLISIIYIHFYINNESYIKILELILKYQENYMHSQCLGMRIRHLYIVYAFLAISNFVNIYKGFEYSGLRMGIIISYTIFFTMGFVICGIVIILYVSVTKILNSCLKHVNNEILKILIGNECALRTEKMYDLMMQRKSILGICQTELSYQYGFLFIPIVAYILFITPSGPYFVISSNYAFKFHNDDYFGLILLIIQIYWDIPWLVIFLLLMSCNSIEKEANKTAQILAKVSRTNTSIDQMIDKFLLKNLRQKPILTAYGFFSLDKSTLFKLFTAIFTYMVILVQFKEMESTTKKVNNQP